MQELAAAITRAFVSDTYKIILSAPIKNGDYHKVVATRKVAGILLEQYTDTQVFHRTVTDAEMTDYLLQMLGSSFGQLHSWQEGREHSIRVTAKGKVLTTNRVVAGEQQPQVEQQHNRVKSYILQEGNPIPPLVDMGIFTAEGKVVRSMYDKYRQINRFIEIIDDEVSRLPVDKPITVIDFGCGKSYLTFVLYYYLVEVRGITVRMIGLDLKREVIESCQRAAEKYGYSGLSFELGDINGYKLEGGVDMVVTLHACDTATDYALYNAINWDARLIFSVPCCQHELNGQMQSDSLSLLTRYGIVKERVAALMTDAIRASLLEYSGYRTQLLEFIDISHTPKNILIRAVKKPTTAKKANKALAEAQSLINEFDLNPTLYRLIAQKETPPK